MTGQDPGWENWCFRKHNGYGSPSGSGTQKSYNNCYSESFVDQQAEKGTLNRVRKLFGFLRKGDDKMLEDLIGALRDSEQEHVADIIVEARKSAGLGGANY